MLRIISSFGFGRQVVAPALSALAKAYPQLELRFDVEDRLVDLVNEGVDLDIRIGDDIAPNLIARKLATNYRILCASPEFIAQYGTPKHLTDLSALPCLVIKERDHPFGVWQLRNKEGHHAIKVTGQLSSNHGEIVHQWCLDGQGLRYALVGCQRKYCQWSFSASATGVLPASKCLGRLCFKAGDVSESADNGRILRQYFAEHYPNFSLDHA